MKDYLQLLKVLLIEQFRLSKEGKKQRKMQIIALVLLSPMAVLFFIGMLEVGKAVAPMDIFDQVLTILITLCQVVVLFFGLPVMLNTVYFSKDTEMVLSLPVKPFVAFAAKFTVVYIVEFTTTLLFTVCGFLPFGIGAGANVGFYFALIIGALFVPLLALLLVSLIAIPLMYVVSFFRSKGFLSTIVYTLLFAVVFILYYLFINSMVGNGGEATELDKLIAALIESINIAVMFVYPNLMLARVMACASFGSFALNLLGVIGINAVLLAVTLLISNAIYKRSISKQLENPKNNNKDTTQYSSTNKIKTLIGKDIKEITRFSSLGFYCMIQVVLAPIVIWFMLLNFNTGFNSGGEGNAEQVMAVLEQFKGYIAIIILVMLSFFTVSMNVTATGAISRENTNFYMNKLLPVDFKTVMDAKVILATVFTLVATLISYIVVVVFMPFLWGYAIVGFVVVNLYGVALAYLQVYFDLRSPRLNWKTINEGMKNSSSQLWSMLFGFILMVFFGGLGGLCFYLDLSYKLEFILPLYWSIMCLVGVLAVFICRKQTLNHCEVLLEKIEG